MPQLIQNVMIKVTAVFLLLLLKCIPGRVNRSAAAKNGVEECCSHLGVNPGSGSYVLRSPPPVTCRFPYAIPPNSGGICFTFPWAALLLEIVRVSKKCSLSDRI